MKKLKFLSYILIPLFGLIACNEGIDDIQPFDPGPDAASPDVNIIYPTNGTQVRATTDIMAIDIQFTASDDIELDNVTVLLDNQQIAFYNDFVDYRSFGTTLNYGQLSNGDHTLSVVATDLVGNTTTETSTFTKAPPYQLIYPEMGEMFYMPFDGDFVEQITLVNSTITGTPGFAGQSVEGTNAYAGATGSYVLQSATDLSLGNEFSAAFWYNLNSSPDRAGVLTMSKANPDASAELQNIRTQGFRIFREAAGAQQRLKANIGIGSGEVWLDGGEAANISPYAGNWAFITLSVSQTSATFYVNGQPIATGTMGNPINWTDVETVSVGSGAPYFNEWGHLSDLSFIDELRLFSTALTQEQVQSLMND